jgi:excisionase family DNA binding protein
MTSETTRLTYRFDQAAELLGVSVATVSRRVSSGEFPHVPLRRVKVIPASWLQGWIEHVASTHPYPCANPAQHQHRPQRVAQGSLAVVRPPVVSNAGQTAQRQRSRKARACRTAASRSSGRMTQ